MTGSESVAPTEVARTLETGLLSLDSNASFWWRTTGYTLAHMLLQACYTIHAQYACLLFYRSTTIPSLGDQPTIGGIPTQWKSYATDDFSPIEYSWNWDKAGK